MLQHGHVLFDGIDSQEGFADFSALGERVEAFF